MLCWQHVAVSVELETENPPNSNLQVEAKCEREAAVAAKKAARDAERAAAKALSVEERRFAKEAARCAKLGLPPPSPMPKCAQASWHPVPTLGTQSDRSSHRLFNCIVQLPNQVLLSFCSGVKLACGLSEVRRTGCWCNLSSPCCKHHKQSDTITSNLLLAPLCPRSDAARRQNLLCAGQLADCSHVQSC